MLLFLVDLINIEIFRISFSFFYSFSFILRSRATSVRRSMSGAAYLLAQVARSLSGPLIVLFHM